MTDISNLTDSKRKGPNYNKPHIVVSRKHWIILRLHLIVNLKFNLS